MREFDTRNINPRCVFGDLLINLWAILFAAAIGFMGADLYASYIYKPEYTSSVTFVAAMKDPASSVASTLSTESSLAEVFTDVMSSDILKNLVSEKLGVTEFPGKVTSEVIPSTNLFKVSVTSKAPILAYNAVVALTENYPSVSDYIFSNAVIDILQKPELPVEASNAINQTIVRIAATAICALLATAGIVALSIFRGTVKTTYTAKTELAAPLFGIVAYEPNRKDSGDKADKHSKNAKPLLSIRSPETSPHYIEEIFGLASKLEFAHSHKKQKVFMFTSVSPNEGKTTVSSNIALALSMRTDSRVLLVDFDIRKPSVHSFFRDVFTVDKKKTLSTVLFKNVPLEEAITEVSPNLFLLPEVNAGYSYDEIISERVVSLFAECREKFDYVIVDTSPNSVASDSELLSEYCDAALIVVMQDYALVENINDTIYSVGKGGAEILGCILNRTDKRSAEIRA